jgi:hypothetical protein
MNDPIVQNQSDVCEAAARRVESAAQALGREWRGYAPLMELSSRFRQHCEELAATRGLEMETISFVGPKKSGKSTTIRLLVQDESVRNRIKAGPALRDSTEKLVWIGPKQPSGIDPALEEYVPCPEGAMPCLGVPTTLVDVPGDNEGDPARAEAAQRALDLSLLKVLVTEFGDRRNEAVLQLVTRMGRSVVLPIITKIKPTDEPAELLGYRERLQEIAPDATVLEPLESREFEHSETPLDYEPRFARELVMCLAGALAGRQLAPLTANLLEGERVRFLAKAREIATENLRASAGAIDQFDKASGSALIAAASNLLGDDRRLRVGIRWTLRMRLLERTPIWCWPWRPALALAAVTAGVVDRLPTALGAAIPSLITIMHGTIRNFRQAAGGSATASEALREGLNFQIRTTLRGDFAILDDALRLDLGEESRELATGQRSSIEPTGLAELQKTSNELFHLTLEENAPDRFASLLAGICGFLIFWGIFGWPLASLYQQLHQGALAVWRDLTSAALFPQATASMLFTAVFLALVPMYLFLLAILGWFVRASVVDDCMAELRSRHPELCWKLLREGEVSVRVSEPKLDACRALLGKEAEFRT